MQLKKPRVERDKTLPTCEDKAVVHTEDDHKVHLPKNSLLTPEIRDLVKAMSIQLLSLSAMEVEYTEGWLQAKLVDAKKLLGLDVIYDAAMFEGLELNNFQFEDFMQNDAQLRAGIPLEHIIEPHLVPLRLKGLQPTEFRQYFKGCPSLYNAMDIVSVGSRRYMKPDFIENGFRGISIGGSYRKVHPICNDFFIKLVREGKALVLTRDALEKSNQRRKIHGS
jgi:hypothetical protein